MRCARRFFYILFLENVFSKVIIFSFLPPSPLEGVTRHVGEALGDEVHVRGSKIVALGIAPWGVVQQRDMLVGIDVSLRFHSPLPFN